MVDRIFQIEMVDIRCGECDVIFGMEKRFYDARRNDRKVWYCPNGHGRSFNAHMSDAARLQEAQNKLERVSTENVILSREKQRVSSQFKQLRKRVFNGVCPCCTRSFSNLLMHMRNQHPDYLTEPTSLLELRKIFGMTQAEVAEEACVSSVYVSQFERGAKVPEKHKRKLDSWMKTYTNSEEKV